MRPNLKIRIRRMDESPEDEGNYSLSHLTIMMMELIKNDGVSLTIFTWYTVPEREWLHDKTLNIEIN